MNEVVIFYESIKNIKYGWHNKKGDVFKTLKEGDFYKNYYMQDIKNIKKSGYAICWELCELERKFFRENKFNYKTIFALSREDGKYFCHTFLIFENNDCWYWFEASWNNQKGIHKFSSINEILEYIKNNFSDFVGKKDYDKEKVVFFSYKKPYFIRRCNLFYFHCMKTGVKIK